MRIVLLGSVYVGKSSSGNTILGNEAFDLRRTVQCVRRQGDVAGRQVAVVEAPGHWGNVNISHTLELIKQEIVLSVSWSPPGPHAILLVTSADSSFTGESLKSIHEHMGLLGERVWNHTMVLFTFGD